MAPWQVVLLLLLALLARASSVDLYAAPGTPGGDCLSTSTPCDISAAVALAAVRCAGVGTEERYADTTRDDE